MSSRIAGNRPALQIHSVHRVALQGSIELLAFVVAKLLEKPRRNYKDRWVNTRELALNAQARKAAAYAGASEPRYQVRGQRDWSSWLAIGWTSARQWTLQGLHQNAAHYTRLVQAGSSALQWLDQTLLSIMPRFPGAQARTTHGRACFPLSQPMPALDDCEWSGEGLERVLRAIGYQFELYGIDDLANTPLGNITLFGPPYLADCIHQACPGIAEIGLYYRIDAVLDYMAVSGSGASQTLPFDEDLVRYWFSSRLPPHDNETAVVEDWDYNQRSVDWKANFAVKYWKPLVMITDWSPPPTPPGPPVAPAQQPPATAPAAQPTAASTTGGPVSSSAAPGSGPGSTPRNEGDDSPKWTGAIVASGIGGILLGTGGAWLAGRVRQHRDSTQATVSTSAGQALATPTPANASVQPVLGEDDSVVSSASSLSSSSSSESV